MVEATGAIIVAGAVIAVGSWLYNAIVDWFTSGSAYSKSVDDVVDGLNGNDQHHIMNEKHNWNKIDKDPKGPKWEVVAGVLKKTLKEGEEVWENDNVYHRTLIYKGEEVTVRFIKNSANLVYRISTAWVK